MTSETGQNFIIWQCDLHAITVTSTLTGYGQCCEIGRELGAYTPAAQAMTLVGLALQTPIQRPSVAESVVAEYLTNAIERHDETAQAYHGATLDAIADLKRIVLAAGGEWK